MTRPPGDASGMPSPRLPEAHPTAAAGTRSVAVVSDSSALHHQDRRPHTASVHPLVRDCADLIHRLTDLPVVPVVVDAADAEHLAARLRELSGEVAAVYLMHTDPARARAAAQAVHDAGGPAVLTEQDATAVTLTAALLVILARLGRAPAASQVVIAGAAPLSLLPQLVMAAGVGDIIRWTRADRGGFPLQVVTERADALIDLLGGSPDITRAAANRPHLAVIAPDEPTDPLLAVPGLLRALAAAHPALTLEVALAAAFGVAAATPSSRLLPDLTDPDLTRAVVEAVTRLLDPPGSSGHRPPRSRRLAAPGPGRPPAP